MGFVGLLLQLATIGLVGYLGYTFQLNYYILLLAPFGLMLGQLMWKSARSSSRAKGGFIERITSFVTSYVVSLVFVAVCFGVGYAIYHVLVLRPAEGTGRY